MNARATGLAPALLWLALAAGCGASEGATPSRIDVPAVAEALRRSERELSGACGGGFPAFVDAARVAISRLEGSGPFVRGLETYARPGGAGLAPRDLADPAMFRLFLHRYGDLCRGPESRELARQLEPLAGVPRDESSRRLQEVLRARARGLQGLDVRALPGGQAVVAELPAPGGREADAVTFLSCLACREGSPVRGATQIASVLAAFETVAASRVVLGRPLRLVVCLDASAKPGACAEGFDDGLRQTSTVFALDGAEPLVVSWSAEVAWHLEVAHEPPGPLPARPRRGQRDAPLVLDAGAPGEIDELPVEAWMVLADPVATPAEFASRVETEAKTLESAREGTSFEVEARRDGTVRVAAKGEQLPAWEISRLHNALWDLSALAVTLGVEDPPRGGLAAMLRATQRFDRDPQGRRLGLHYADPVGGPLLVSPSTLAVREGKAILAVRMYRPPGLSHRAFLDRLDEARRRLRLAAGRPVGEAAREVADPSEVDPSADSVHVVQRAFEQIVGEGLPEPTGAPRPGLGALLPQAIALRPPTQPTRSCRSPALALILELVWFEAVATDPEVSRASEW
jgi:hypothetical protein